MAKTNVSEWDIVASNNITINGINIDENCPPSTINNAIREMMSQIKKWKDGYTDLATGLPIYQSLTVQNIDVKGIIKLDGSAGTDGQFLMSKGASDTPTWTTLTVFVKGMIMLWSGSIDTIPSGWALCNGANGTPNLRDRFVVGAGTSYAVNATGGANTRNTSSKSLTTSSKSVVVNRDGWGTTGGPLGTAQNGRLLVGSGQREYAEGLESIRASGRNLTTGTHNHTVGSHNHSIDTRSPYYALAYIMKL